MAVTAAAKKAAGGGEEEKAAYVSACRAAGVSPVPNGSTWHKNGGAELEPLLDFTTLIDVRWLLKVAEGEVTCVDERGNQLPTGVVPAWQQLPDEAKARLEQMWMSKMDYGLPVGVLSYGWASKVCRGLSAPSPHRTPLSAEYKACFPRYCARLAPPFHMTRLLCLLFRHTRIRLASS